MNIFLHKPYRIKIAKTLHLFYVRKGPGGDWSKPINLGYPINTISREGTLFIEANGKTAYYASDRSDSKGGLDIYAFELYEKARPLKTGYLKGVVYDAKTLKKLRAKIELIDLETAKTVIESAPYSDFALVKFINLFLKFFLLKSYVYFTIFL